MIKVSQLQRDNLLSAKEMWLTVPERNVTHSLGMWRHDPEAKYQFRQMSKPTCNTLACFGGWCTWWPAFRAQGLRASSLGGAPHIEGIYSSSPERVSKTLFGDPDLFYPRGDRISNKISDWQVVMDRINKCLENSEIA